MKMTFAQAKGDFLTFAQGMSDSTLYLERKSGCTRALHTSDRGGRTQFRVHVMPVAGRYRPLAVPVSRSARPRSLRSPRQGLR